MPILDWTQLERNGDHVSAGGLGHYLIEEETAPCLTYVLLFRARGSRTWKEIGQYSDLGNAKQMADNYDRYRARAGAA